MDATKRGKKRNKDGREEGRGMRKGGGEAEKSEGGCWTKEEMEGKQEWTNERTRIGRAKERREKQQIRKRRKRSKGGEGEETNEIIKR